MTEYTALRRVRKCKIVRESIQDERRGGWGKRGGRRGRLTINTECGGRKPANQEGEPVVVLGYISCAMYTQKCTVLVYSIPGVVPVFPFFLSLLLRDLSDLEGFKCSLASLGGWVWLF